MAPPPRPRPRGCETCRHRKIRCDLGVPECQRCFTTGRKCLGYTSWPWRWRYERPGPNSKGTCSGPEDNCDEDAQQRSKALARVATAEIHCDRSSNPPFQIGRSPAQAAVIYDALGAVFMERMYPNNAQPDLWSNFPGGWICSLPTIFHGQSKVLSQGLLALYAGFVGRRTGDVALVYRGKEFYASALCSLRDSKVWTRLKPDHDEVASVLAGILVLSRVELLAGEGGTGGYTFHVRGGLGIIKRFGRRLPQSPLMRTVIRAFRALGFYDACRNRLSFFMSRPPYISLYPTNPHEHNYLVQRIVEIVITIPDLWERADNLDAAEYTTDEEVRQGLVNTQDILDSAYRIKEEIDVWFDELCAFAPSPALEASSNTGESPQYPYGQRLSFRDCYASCLWLHYWCITGRFYILIKQLQRRFLMLSRRASNTVRLPAYLATLDQDYALLDHYADLVGISLSVAFSASTFHAQESLVFMFHLVWYWEQRGNAEKTSWCIRVIEALKEQGLVLDTQVRESSTGVPSLSAKFLLDETLSGSFRK